MIKRDSRSCNNNSKHLLQSSEQSTLCKSTKRRETFDFIPEEKNFQTGKTKQKKKKKGKLEKNKSKWKKWQLKTFYMQIINFFVIIFPCQEMVCG